MNRVERENTQTIIGHLQKGCFGERSVTETGTAAPQVLSVRKLWKGCCGLEEIPNFFLKRAIRNGTYVPVDVKESNDTPSSIIRVYAKAQELNDLVLSKKDKEHHIEEIQTALSNKKQDLLISTVQKIQKNIFPIVYRQNQSGAIVRQGFQDLDRIQVETDDIDDEDIELIQWRGRWYPVLRRLKGGSLDVSVCNNIAIKTLKKTSQKRLQTAFEEAKKTREILAAINPNDEATGIQEAPISPLMRRSFTVYTTSGNTVKRIPQIVPVQIETAFMSDCNPGSITIPPEEIPSVAADLISGSKILIENDIYHLDAKTRNMAYFGNGRAGHFDIGGSINLKTDPWPITRFTHTPSCVFKDEVNRIKTQMNPERAGQAMKSLHIFELGSALFQISAKELPYSKHTKENYLSDQDLPSEKDLRERLQKGNGFTERQKNTVVKMLSLNPSKRPDFAEVERAFPPPSVNTPRPTIYRKPSDPVFEWNLLHVSFEKLDEAALYTTKNDLRKKTR